MVYSRHRTAEAANRAADRYRKDDPHHSFYVVCASCGVFLYAVICSREDSEEE